MLAPRTLATEPPPSGPAAARLVWMDPTRAAVGGDGIARAEVRALLKGMAVLVHAVAPSAAHGRGLMSEKLTRLQLTAARLDVEPAVRMPVRAALRGEAPVAGTGLLAATTDGEKRER